VLDVGTHFDQTPDVGVGGANQEGRMVDEQAPNPPMLGFLEHREDLGDVEVAAGEYDIMLRDQVLVAWCASGLPGA